MKKTRVAVQKKHLKKRPGYFFHTVAIAISLAGALFLYSRFNLHKVIASTNVHTAVLSDADTGLPASGNGMVTYTATNGSYARMTNYGTSPSDYIGYSNGSVTRSYLEFDTTNLPKSAIIQSVAIYLNISKAYGKNTVNIVKLPQPISNYSNTQAGNQQLFNDLGSAPVYFKSATGFQKTGDMILTLSPLLPSSGTQNSLISDLQIAINAGQPFGVGLVGSNETGAVTAFTSEQNLSYPTQHPAMIVFYDGLGGFAQPPERPLRNSFFDGTNYWQFSAGNQEQDYYVSSDGLNWQFAGKFSSSVTRHFSVWYAGNNKVYVLNSESLSKIYKSSNDSVLRIGTINGQTISWGNPSRVFSSVRSTSYSDGYDVPSVAVDSNGICWALDTHYQKSTSGIVVTSSTDQTCTAWKPPTVLLPLGSSNIAVEIRGGYIVPLTNGKMYAVYKDYDGTYGPLYGQLYDGSSWQPRETIDATAAKGLYQQGMSIIASGDTVYLAYIHSDGSLISAVRTGSSWTNSQTIESGTFLTPNLSLDTSTGNLYLFYRTLGSPDHASGQIFDRVGTVTGNTIAWSAEKLLVANSWVPILDPQGWWALSSNYSVNSSSGIFAQFVDGEYGVATILP